jgi:hypothetical protein
MMEFGKRVSQDQLGPNGSNLVTFYYFLQLSSGNILLPFLLAVFILSPKVNRHPTLLNLIISFIFSSITACLLLYANRHVGPQPSHGLCVAQAGLINAITPMWGTASLVLVYNIWNTFYCAVRKQPRADSITKRVAMLAAPYIVWAIWSASSLYFAFANQDTVNRDRRVFYCSMDYAPFSTAMSVFTSLICLVVTGFQVHLGILFYRNYHVGGSSAVDMKFVVRTLIFGVYTLAGMFVSLATLLYPSNSFADIFAASFGFVAFFVFGTQGDVLAALKFWGRKEDSTSTLSRVQSLHLPSKYSMDKSNSLV